MKTKIVVFTVSVLTLLGFWFHLQPISLYPSEQLYIALFLIIALGSAFQQYWHIAFSMLTLIAIVPFFVRYTTPYTLIVFLIVLIFYSRTWYGRVVGAVIPSAALLGATTIFQDVTWKKVVYTGIATYSISLAPWIHMEAFEFGGVGGSIILSVVLICFGILRLGSTFYWAGTLYIVYGVVGVVGYSWTLFPVTVTLLGIEISEGIKRVNLGRTETLAGVLFILFIIFSATNTVSIIATDEAVQSVTNEFPSLTVSSTIYEKYAVFLPASTVTSSVDEPILIDPYRDSVNVTRNVLQAQREGRVELRNETSVGFVYVPIAVQSEGR